MAHGDGRGVGRGGVVVMRRRGAALNRWKRRGFVGAPGIYAHSGRACVVAATPEEVGRGLAKKWGASTSASGLTTVDA
jgi:hypothetical protein